MAHEILTVKLCEMDETIGRLHCRIHLSETAKYTQLCQEIETISREYAETELALRKKLKYSHSKMVSLLAENYEEIEQIIQKSVSVKPTTDLRKALQYETILPYSSG